MSYSSSLDQSLRSPAGPLELPRVDRGVAVARLRLQREQRAEVAGRGLVGRLQQRDGFAMVLALCVLTKPCAADNVRGRDTGVDAQRREGISDVLMFLGEVAHEVRSGKELLSFAQPSLTG